MRRLDARGARDRDQERREAGEPCERHLERRRPVSRCDRVQNRIGGSTGEGLSTAERAIRQQAQPVLEAVARNAAQKVLVMPQAQLDLNRFDLGDAPRFFDLSHGHVAEADGADAAVTLERGERTNAGRKRTRGSGLWS